MGLRSEEEEVPAIRGRDWERKETWLRWQNLREGWDLGSAGEKSVGKEWCSERSGA